MALNTGVRFGNAFRYRCDITRKALADSTKNIESNVTLSSLYSSVTITQFLLNSGDGASDFAARSDRGRNS